jgi:hypothetical protein
MLAEIAIATSAYKTIKAGLMAGKELYDVGDQLTKYFGAQSSLAKKVEHSSKPRNEMEEFFALEKMKAQEKELREWMIWYGRPGLWDDWIRFQANCAVERKEAIKDEAIRKQRRYNAFQSNIATGIKAGVILVLIMGALFGVAVYMRPSLI